MKIIVNNSELIFAKLQLTEISKLSLNGITSTATFTGYPGIGDYYFKVESQSTTPLEMSFQAGLESTLLKEFAPNDFGKNFKITLSGQNLYFKGNGNYTLTISQANATFNKLGEVTMASAYNGNKVLAHTSIDNALANILSQHAEVYLKVSDSNNLIFPDRGYSVFNYASGGNTNYGFDNFLLDCIIKSTNVPFAGNIYVQGLYNVSYTPSAGDTTIKIEFFEKV